METMKKKIPLFTAPLKEPRRVYTNEGKQRRKNMETTMKKKRARYSLMLQMSPEEWLTERSISGGEVS